jgi:acetyltransferase (GNAT) family protein
MADRDRDAMLREMAANRRCRLVKSRRRRPGGDYGRYGLKDASSGKEVLGFGTDGLTATPEEIEDFLRGGAAAEWKRSLGVSGKTKKSGAAKRKSPPPPKPKKAEPPPLRIREADSADAGAIAALIGEADADAVADRVALLARGGEPPLVARRGEALLGCAAWHVEPSLHRPRPRGRITLLAVAPRSGAGKALTEAAEARLRARGCEPIELARDARR